VEGSIVKGVWKEAMKLRMDSAREDQRGKGKKEKKEKMSNDHPWRYPS